MFRLTKPEKTESSKVIGKLIWENTIRIFHAVFANFYAILQLKQENWKIVWMQIKNRCFCFESIRRHRRHCVETNLTSYSNLFSHSRDCVFDIPGNKKSGNIVSKSPSHIHSLTRKIRKKLRHKFHPASTLMCGWEHNSRFTKCVCGFPSFPEFLYCILSRHPYNWSMHTLNNDKQQLTCDVDVIYKYDFYDFFVAIGKWFHCKAIELLSTLEF